MLFFPRLLAVVLLLSTSLLTGCGSKPVVVTDEESGELVELSKGQELQVKLPSNPTTGYSWGLTENADQILSTSGKSFFTQDTSGEGQVGVGGIETWVFDAAEPGETTLRFEYRQPFEKGALPVKVIRYQIKVS